MSTFVFDMFPNGKVVDVVVVAFSGIIESDDSIIVSFAGIAGSSLMVSSLSSGSGLTVVVLIPDAGSARFLRS